MNMEDDILNQDEDLIEQEMKKDVETKKSTEIDEDPINAEGTNPSKIEETFEAFHHPERFGIVNTLTGDTIEGFDSKKDEGIVRLGKIILNQLNKISIASGAQ